MIRETREIVECIVILYEKGVLSREEADTKITRLLQYAGYGDDIIETYLVFFLG